MLYGFAAGGAETDASVRENRAAFNDYAFVARGLVDVSGRDQTTSLFGRQYAAPFGIAPMGASALFAYRADLAFARAAHSAGVPMILSASSLIRLEEVRAAGPTAWYQAYIPGDAGRIEALMDRVGAAGFDTFVVTIDVPVSANRENNIRNGYSLPVRPSLRLFWEGATHPRWLMDTAVRTYLQHGMPHFENLDAFRGPPVLSDTLLRDIGPRDQLTWEHIALMRRKWKGSLVIKGVLHKTDARMAREHGLDGVLVSNHGGRQLDHAIAPLRVLPEIAAEARGMAVLYDSGIRRGTDVLKALALGASFVFVGRPMLFAASIGGEEAVRHGIRLLSDEIDRDMALLGISRLAELAPALVRRIRGPEADA
jgi:L-lactate dehydrogenase (cytochrome)